jgi:ubiquinone/menaquinone biosynthesis C-methylase UbiE
MNKGELYAEISKIHHDDFVESIKIFKDKFKWKSDGSDALLDIGCGDGSVTSYFIAATLSPETKVVAIDKCKDMIENAKKCFENKNLKFSVMNIEEDLVGDLLRPESFNIITSFLAFQYVENLRFL